METQATQKSILIVEDEHLIRQLSVEELGDAGFRVIEAETADDALKIMESGEAIALVFTDVNTPGVLTGLQLSKLVLENWPEVQVIVTSGGGQVTASHVTPPGRFMIKPYAFKDMVAVVRSLTEEHG